MSSLLLMSSGRRLAWALVAGVALWLLVAWAVA